jgi:hypothetical protein
MVSIMRVRFPWFPWTLYMFSVVLAGSMVSMVFVRFTWFLWFLCGVHGFYNASPVSMLSMACVVSMRFGWFAVSMFSIVCLRFLWFPWSVYFLCGFYGFHAFSIILADSMFFYLRLRVLRLLFFMVHRCRARRAVVLFVWVVHAFSWDIAVGYYLKECSSRRCQQPKKHDPFWI